MMRRNLFALLLIMPLCWTACEKEIEFSGKIIDPVLVMNGFLTPDSVISVQISESRFMLGKMLDEVPPVVKDASVSLYVNSEYKEQLSHIGDGVYSGTYYPISNDIIRVEAKVDGFDAIWGETIIPRKPLIIITDSSTVISTMGGNTAGEKEIRQVFWNGSLELKMTEHASEENYYFVKGQKYFYLEDGRILSMFVDLGIDELLEQIDPDHASFLEEELFGGYSHMVKNLFSDRFVDGRDLFFDFRFHDLIDMKTYINGVMQEELKNEAEVELKVEIATMTKGMYQYITSASRSNATNGNFLVEPVPVYSNIKNGTGIIESFVPYVITFRYKKRYNADAEDPRYPYY
jgi:hypothetical protein